MIKCRVRTSGPWELIPLPRLAVRFTVKNERLPYACMVDLSLVTDNEIRVLNWMQRGINRATDVLSFPMSNPGDRPDPDTGRICLGDILISTTRAVKQAKDYGHSLERELAYLAAHGALHLMGYDHEREWDRAVMRKKEETVIERMGLLR